jgi:flagellar basal-body rod modification protein FlgD
MPGIEALQNIPGGLQPVAKPSTPSADIDQEGFMRLLVAQLQNQDPLSPLSNEEFVQQLTSFSSLDELRDIKKTMSSLDQLGGISELLGANLALQQTNVNAMSVGLIGKEVEASTNKVELGKDTSARIVFDLPEEGASEVTFRLKGDSGQVLYEVKFDPSNPPEGFEVRDGRVYAEIPRNDLNGSPLPAGAATVEALAGASTVQTSLIGVAKGIDFRGSKTLLSIDGIQVDLTSIVAVNNHG